MDGPLLSIVIPVYNGAEAVRACLDALLGQTYRNLEVICVDDGSTDTTWAVVQEYAARDSRIRGILQENAGVSAARNRGLDAATGEYVTFVDADDWVEKSTYEIVLSAFTPEVELVCFGVTVDGGEYPELEEYCNLIPEGEMLVTPVVLSRMNASIWNKIYRTNLIRQSGACFPAGVAYGEDAAFFFCYAAVIRKIYGVKQKLYHYVQNTGSAMANPAIEIRRAGDLLNAFDSVYALYERLQALPRMRPVLEMLFCSFWHFAKAGKMELQLLPRATEAAARSGVLYSCRHPHVLELRMRNLPAWEKLFHWYTGNRECYGLAGRALFSITYEPEQWIYRCLGRRIKNVQRDPAPSIS